MATLPLSPSAEATILEAPPTSTPHAPTRVEMSGPEAYEFIRTCLSHRPISARKESARSYLESGIDWATVRREARRHRVLPFFFRVLDRLLGTQLPNSIRDQIEEHRRGVRIQNTFLAQELGRVAQQFEDAALPLLTMKGPVLAKTAYNDLAARQSVDMDVVVPSHEFSEADHTLHDLGYEYAAKRKRITGWRKTFSLYLDGQWQFARAGGTFSFDVHTRVMPPGYPFPSTFQPFWERARKVPLSEDVRVWGFAPEDMILILSYHGIKNQWRALKYIVDLAELIRATPEIDWPALVERAQKMKSTRVLRLGLALSQEVLETSLPEDVQKWIRSNPMDDTSLMIKKHLHKGDRSSVLPYGKRVQLQLATKDTVASKLRYGAYSTLQHLWSTFLKP